MKLITVKELKILGNGVAEEGRFALEHIHITKDYAEVTDGKMMIRHKIASSNYKVELKDKKSVVISPASLTGKEVEITIGDKEMTTKSITGTMVSPHPVDVEFPDTDGVLKEAKKEKTVIKTALSQRLLEKILKSIPPVNKYEGDAIIFEFKAPDKAVYFTRDNIEGLILPVRLEEEKK